MAFTVVEDRLVVFGGFGPQDRAAMQEAARASAAAAAAVQDAAEAVEEDDSESLSVPGKQTAEADSEEEPDVSVEVGWFADLHVLQRAGSAFQWVQLNPQGPVSCPAFVVVLQRVFLSRNSAAAHASRRRRYGFDCARVVRVWRP
jgi:hypothetical protein